MAQDELLARIAFLEEEVKRLQTKLEVADRNLKAQANFIKSMQLERDPWPNEAFIVYAG